MNLTTREFMQLLGAGTMAGMGLGTYAEAEASAASAAAIPGRKRPRAASGALAAEGGGGREGSLSLWTRAAAALLRSAVLWVGSRPPVRVQPGSDERGGQACSG